MHWKKITLVGVGLLGGSLGLALKQRRLAGSVVGYVRRAATIRDCRQMRAVDFATRDLRQAIKDAQLIVLCTPLAQMPSLVEQMRPGLTPGTLLTDVGSVKETVINELEPLLAGTGAYFVGSHPMAGGEKTGVKAARADLFSNAVCVVTPTRQTHRGALRKIEQLWKAVGARVLRLRPAAHDELVSRSSHLPHVLAAELANFVLNPKHPKQQRMLCANGFRDTTRIASGSPEMWRDIAVANRTHLLKALESFCHNLDGFRHLLQEADPDRLRRFFEQARERRERWSKHVASVSPE